MEQPGETSGPQANESNVTKPQSLIDSVFIGPTGLRAGWRLAVYVAMLYFLTFAVSFLFSPLFRLIPEGRMHEPYQVLIGDSIEFFSAVVSAIVMARLEQRPFSVYGLPVRRDFRRNFWDGVLWGIVSITLLLAIMRALGLVYFGHIALPTIRLIKFAAFWGLVFLVVAFCEEFVMRGYAQFTLSDGIGFWPAAVVLSSIFGAAHLLNPGENWHGAVGAAVIGFFWCFTLRRTGTLWFGIGMHVAWDWCETFLYAVPDSGLIEPGHLFNSTFRGKVWLTGGPAGPEGSVLLFIVIAALWILFDRLHPEVKYKVTA